MLKQMKNTKIALFILFLIALMVLAILFMGSRKNGVGQPVIEEKGVTNVGSTSSFKGPTGVPYVKGPTEPPPTH